MKSRSSTLIKCELNNDILHFKHKRELYTKSNGKSQFNNSSTVTLPPLRKSAYESQDELPYTDDYKS